MWTQILSSLMNATKRIYRRPQLHNSKLMRMTAIVAALVVSLVTASDVHAQSQLIAYWNFNTATTQTTLETVSQGTGTLSGSSTGRTNFGGTTTNALNADPAGQSLVVQSTSGSNNGNNVIFQISMTNRASLVMTFASQRSSTGFNSNQMAYSTDGATYTNFGAAFDPGTSFALQTFDMSSVTALNNASTVFIRITLGGATGTSQNIRFDNVQFNACAIPAAPTGTTWYNAVVGSPTTMTVTVGANQTADWFTGSCGGTTVPGGSGATSISVTPTAIGTITYFVRTRNTGTCTNAGTSCLQITLAANPAVTDTTATGATVDGTLGTNEYGPSNSYAFAGGGTSFGGPLGNGTLYVKSDASNLYIAYALGATLNDSVALLIDTGSSSPATYPNDTSGGDQRAISRLLNNNTATLPPTGFRASFAVIFAGNNQSANNRFYSISTTAVNSAALGASSGTGSNFGNVREVRIPLSTLGVTSGGSVRLLAALSNPSGTPAFLSSESIPPNPTLNSNTQPGTSGGTFTNFANFTTVTCTTINTGLTVSAAASTICAGGSASITVASSQTGVSYQLRSGTTNINAAQVGNGGTLTFTDTPSSTTTYNILATSCATSTQLTQTATVTVNTAPGTPTGASADTPSFCTVGGPTNITLSATLNSGTSIQWFTGSCGGTAVTPISSTSTSVTIAAPTSTTTYFARATDGTCTSASCASVTVTVNPSPSTGLTVAAAASSLCSGGSTNITVAASQSGVSYQLRNNADNALVGSAVAGTGGTINLPTGNLTSTTTFNVVATGTGCNPVQLTQTATVTITSPPNAGLTVAAASSSICSGTGTNITVALSETGVSYQLRDNSNNSNVGAAVNGTGGTINLPTGNLVSTTTFNVLATRCSAIQLTQTATVTVNSTPSNPTGTTTYNATTGAPLTITAAVGVGVTVDWFTGTCGGTPVSGGTGTASLNIASVPNGVTTYFARARNTLSGCLSSGCLAVTVNATSQIVISQVYGGGGNSSAIYRNDFVELFNRGTTAVSLSGWTLQYASDTGAFNSSVALSGTIQPNSYYLIGLASGGAIGALLPSTDVSTTSINMGGTGGKVALANDTSTVLAASSTNVIDYVGYGSATASEGSSTSAPSNTLSVFRILNGCTDTSNNLSDFAVGTPRPRNSSSPRNVCGGGLSETISDTGGSSGTVDGTLGTNEYGTANANRYGGDGSGFGGMIGYVPGTIGNASATTSPRVFMKSDFTGVNIGVRLGANLGATDTVVILLDTVSGGVSGGTTLGAWDNGDTTQRAIVRAIQANLPAGFGIDQAIGINTFGVFAFNVSSGGLTFLNGNSAAGSGTLASQFREMRIPYSNLTGFTAGGNINFIALLNNGGASPNTTLSDESIPVSPAQTGAGNPGNSGGSFTNFNRFVTVACTTPSISQQPQNQTACSTGTASFSVTATGTGLTYQWRNGTTNLSNGSGVSGADSATLSLTGAALIAGNDYNVVITGSCGAVTSSNASLAVQAAASVSAGTLNASYCQGAGPVTLSGSASGIASTTWSVSPANAVTFDDASSPSTTFTVSPTATGTVTLTLTGTSIAPCSGDVTSQVSFTVQPTPTGTASAGTSTIYVGQAVPITASVSDAGGFTWSASGGIGNFAPSSGPGPSAHTTFTLSGGTIGNTVTLSLAAAATTPCSGSPTVATVAFTIVPPPCTPAAVTSFSASPSSTICESTSVTFTAIATGTLPITYTFKKDGGTVQSGTSSTFTIPAAALTDAGIYTVDVSNSCGSDSSSSIALVVNANTAISTQPPSTASQCSGSSTSFGVIATGTNLTYAWQQSTNAGMSWAPAAGTNNAASYTTDPAAVDATLFRCVVSGDCGAPIISGTVTLTVNNAPSIASQPPTTVAACVGQTPVISVLASGTAPLTYAWEYSTDSGGTWNLAPGGTNANTYTLPAVALSDAGNQYRVIISNACGTITSGVSTLSIGGAVNLSITVRLLDVNAGTIDRCIIATLYDGNCPGGVEYPLTITFTNGVGTGSISTVTCGNYTGISVRDPLHTLRRTAFAGSPAFDTSNPNSLVATFTVATGKALIGGNVNDDEFVDILDFGGYIGQIGTNVPSNTGCTGGLNADFTGNGSVFTDDFSVIQANFLAVRESDPCGSPLVSPPNQPGGPITNIGVLELTTVGLWSYARADLNRDWRLDQQDVAFVAMNGVPRCTADYNGVGGISIQDVFDYLNGWMAQHPATDADANGTLGVSDVFTFLNHYFSGC